MEKYFAYGSNMNHDQLCARCPSARFMGPPRLDGYQLAFSRRSSNHGGGIADILATNGASIWDGLFELSPPDFLTLDRSEGTNQIPPANRRVDVEIEPLTRLAGVTAAFTYEVVTKSSFKPSAPYLGVIKEGAAHCSLPTEYIQTLRTIEVA